MSSDGHLFWAISCWLMVYCLTWAATEIFGKPELSDSDVKRIAAAVVEMRK